LIGCGLFYEEIIRVWLGREVESLIFAFFAILKIFSILFNSIYSYFMNGTGKLKPQIYSYCLGLLIGVPIIYYGAIAKNIYICLSVTPLVLIITAIFQRHQVYNKELLRL
jgi:hypothetical protein